MLYTIKVHIKEQRRNDCIVCGDRTILAAACSALFQILVFTEKNRIYFIYYEKITNVHKVWSSWVVSVYKKLRTSSSSVWLPVADWLTMFTSIVWKGGNLLLKYFQLQKCCKIIIFLKQSLPPSVVRMILRMLSVKTADRRIVYKQEGCLYCIFNNFKIF